MNNRFKFRAWDKEQKRMMYMNQQYGLSSQSEIHDDDWTRFWESNFRLQEDKNIVLLQCTGITDKNGTFIFEGDIVLVKGTKHIGIIEYRELSFRIWPNYEPKSLFELFCTSRLEIIGNKFNDPELLEVEG